MTTKELLDVLDYNQPVVARRARYLAGTQDLRYTVDRVDAKARFTSNLCRVAVNAVAERLRIRSVDVTVKGRDVTDEAARLLDDADLDMLLQAALYESLGLGSSYLIVWADEYTGRPTITVESAEQVAVTRHPVTRAVTAAVKRWDVVSPAGVVTETHVVKYEPTRVTHLKRDAAAGKLTFVEGWDNPLGVVPVVPLVNIGRVHDLAGHSVVDDLAPLVDALNKLMSDLLTTSESVARPKRYVTGVNLDEDDDEWVADAIDDGFSADAVADPANEDAIRAEVDGVRSPFKDSDDLWVSEQADAKFGQLAGADMTGYKVGVDLVMQQIMTVTGLPGHLVGVTTANPSTAEALQAAEVALSSRADSRIRVFNAPVEWAVRLLVAVAKGVSPAEVTADVKWAPTTTRSVAAEADAATKLVAAGVVDGDEVKEHLGIEE